MFRLLIHVRPQVRELAYAALEGRSQDGTAPPKVYGRNTRRKLHHTHVLATQVGFRLSRSPIPIFRLVHFLLTPTVMP